MAKSGADDNDEKVNLRLPRGLLADLDDQWQEEGYTSRSEFMREALRDAVYGTRLSRRALEDLAVSEDQFEANETSAPTKRANDSARTNERRRWTAVPGNRYG